ncbi:MAG: sorbosone dehydrogenase family protein [bacterium]|nr:sorbosone dehydrogenase family protein [bacterium]
MRILALVTVVCVAAWAACSLLPERFAFNAPVAHLLFGSGTEAPAAETVRTRLRVPEGLDVELYADDLPFARMLRVTPTGDLLVSLPRSDRIELLERDADGDGRPDGRRTLLEGLDRPHGMDLRDGWLYVAEAGAIARVQFDPTLRETRGEIERVVQGIPRGGNHWTRTLRFGPDGWLYASIGSSCNVCIEEDPRRAAIVRYRPDGSSEQLYATGLRNAVGFDWRPDTGELFATDNGRDLLGDDLPPCELNRIVEGGFYGWPYAYGDNVPDPDLGAGEEDRIARAHSPDHGFRAHNAPLGITFVRGDRAPAAFRGAALVSLHGSWNRTQKDGYKVVSLHWTPTGIEERDFLTGFLLDEDVMGRPVDVAEGPEGSFYVSDDYAGAVYRVFPEGGARATPSTAARTNAGGPAAPALGDPSRGETLYEALACAGCHEPAADAPGAVVISLDAVAARYDEQTLAAFLAAPTPPMPAVEQPEAGRRDLAAYLLSKH